MPNSDPNNIPRNPNVMTPDGAVSGERGEMAREARTKEAAETDNGSFDSAYQGMNEIMNSISSQYPDNPADNTNIDVDIARAMADANAAAEAVSEATAEADANADTNDLEVAVDQVRNAEQEEAAPDHSEIIEKAKKHPGLKNTLAYAGICAMVGVILTPIAYHMLKPSEEKKVESSNPQDADWYKEYYGRKHWHNPQDADWYNKYYSRNAGEVERAQGIIDGYGEQGMWLDKNKPGKGFAFANAAEVAKVCYNNPKEMMKYTGRNQVESLAAFIGSMPDRVRPEGFKGLSILQANFKLENISDEAYDKVLAEFNNAIDVSKADAEVVSGTYHNVYMAYRTEDGRRVGANDTYFDEARNVTHDNMELVRCKTNESNTEVTRFTWTYRSEGGSIMAESMIVKIGPEGCIQPISKDGKGMDNIGEIDNEDEGDDDGGKEIPKVIIPEKGDDDDTGDKDTSDEGTGDEDTGDDDTPDSTPSTDPTITILKSKNPERVAQLDKESHEEIAEDVHTGELKVEQTPEAAVDSGKGVFEKTTNPTTSEERREDFGKAPEIVTNNTVNPAPVINLEQPVSTPDNIQANQIAPENNPAENLGGANYQNPSENTPPPVTPNVEAQAQADANEMTQEEARNMSQAEIDDIFASLGL